VKKRFFVLMTLTVLAFCACNNYFHDLIPPDDNRILSFSVEGQLEGAEITDESVTASVDKDCPVYSLIPEITVSNKATLIPLTLDYLSAAFPDIDIVKEAAAIYETDDLSAYVMDLIKRTPNVNVPALDKPIDFTGPVNFIVVSGQGNIRQYTVYVAADSGEPRLLGFGFSKFNNPELLRDAYTTLNEAAKTIQTAALYPVDMSISYALTPSFEILGDRLVVDGNEVTSGVTTVQFINSGGTQNKTVTVWRNGMSVSYSLTIIFTEDLYSNRSIIDFRFNKAENPLIAANAVGSIINNDNAGTINVQVFYSGARPSMLTARYLSPGTVTVNGIPQPPGYALPGGASTQDFSQPLQYRVVSMNGLYARTYIVNVEFIDIAGASPHITSFSFSSGVNPVLIEDAQGQISESAGLIMLTARYGGYSVPESLIPQFNATGLVTVAGTIQTPGFSAQSFSRQVKYTVSNPENPLLTRDYWVQVNFVRDTSSDAAITAFSFHPDENYGLAEPLTGRIEQNSISVYAPLGSGVTGRIMIPRFVSSGQVSVNGAPQSSGVSALMFDAPIIYTVISANGLYRREYMVNVQEFQLPFMEMVWVPGGSFQMGSADTEDYNAQPPYQVTMSGFYMGKFEVTQKQWETVMGTQPVTVGNYGKGDDYPVYNVSWYDALVFCNKLSATEGLTPAYSISGKTDPAQWGTVPSSYNDPLRDIWDLVEVVSGSTGYRLPTEAQWEYAAKGGDGSPGNYIYAGSNNPDEVAWYSGNNGSSGTPEYGSKPVGTKAANGLSLHDMSGNVWEWCWDWWGNYTSDPKTDPVGASAGSSRVFRGGSWGNSARVARSAYRFSDNPYYRDYVLGFRVSRP